MVYNTVTAVLAEARAAGIILRIEGGELTLRAGSAPPPSLVERLRARREDVLVLARAAKDIHATLSWAAEQLGEIDFPSELGYDTTRHYLKLCQERDGIR
jgi:hypothetical protein